MCTPVYELKCWNFPRMFLGFGLIEKIFFLSMHHKYTYAQLIKLMYLTPTHKFFHELITLKHPKLLLYYYFTAVSTDQVTFRAKMCLLYLIILKVPRHTVDIHSASLTVNTTPKPPDIQPLPMVPSTSPTRLPRMPLPHSSIPRCFGQT